jgi:predicted lipoprotein with Yx(FWY)xxD motif
VIAIVAATAGCGSNYGGGHQATAASAARGGAASVVSTRMWPHGTYLVDGRGRTLYLFEADAPNTSNCTGTCLSVWPGFDAAAMPPRAKSGAIAGKLGRTRGGAGRAFVTYAGHPLYYYVGDRKPGDTGGQGLDQFGAKWYVVAPSGRKIDDD